MRTEAEKLEAALARVSANRRNKHPELSAIAGARFGRMPIGAKFTRYDLITSDDLDALNVPERRVVGSVMRNLSDAGVMVKAENVPDPRRSNRGNIQWWKKVRNL